MKKHIKLYEEFTEGQEAVSESVRPQDMTAAELMAIKPDQKDKDRAEEIGWGGRNNSSFYGNTAPFGAKARKQLASIKDVKKMVRRCKAFIDYWGYGEKVGYSGGQPVEKDRIDVGRECEQALRSMGFSSEQINTIVRSVNEEYVAETEATNESDTFGMKKADYDALIDASTRKKYQPSPEKVEMLMQKFPKISKSTAARAMMLLNSPARNSFTAYDVMSHLKKLDEK